MCSREFVNKKKNPQKPEKKLLMLLFMLAHYALKLMSETVIFANFILPQLLSTITN